MRLPLNSFLLRVGMPPIDALSPTTLEGASVCVWEAGQLQQLSDGDSEDLLSAAVDGDIAVVLLERVGRLPDWQRWIRSVLALPNYGSVPASLGAVIFCAIQSGEARTLHWVAWTFGSASRALKRAATDPRYGLMTALNMISMPAPQDGQGESQEGKGAQLRNLQYRTTGPFFQQTGHRAAKDTPLLGFRMDQQSDLLSAAGGRTSDSTFTEVFGGRSLRFRAELSSLDDLAQMSRLVIAAFADTAYKKHFAWVDNIVQVTDNVLIAELRKALVDELLFETEHPLVDVLLPDDLIDPQDPRGIEWIAYPRERLSNASRLTLNASSVATLIRSVGDLMQR